MSYKALSIVVDGPTFSTDHPIDETYDDLIGNDARLLGWFTARTERATFDVSAPTHLASLANRKVGGVVPMAQATDADRPIWEAAGGPNGKPCFKIAAVGDTLEWTGFNFPILADFSIVTVLKPVAASGVAYNVLGSKGQATNAGATFRVFGDERLMFQATAAAGAHQIYGIRTGPFTGLWTAAIGTWKSSVSRIGLSVNGDDFTFATDALTILADTVFATHSSCKADTRFAEIIAVSCDLSEDANADLRELILQYLTSRYALDLGRDI